MILFARLARSDRQFLMVARQLFARRPSASGLAAPESQKIQSWHGKVFAAPRDINTDDINLSPREFGKTARPCQENAQIGKRPLKRRCSCQP